MKKGKIKSNQTNIFVSGHLRRQLARGLWFSTLPQVKMLQQCNLETSSNFHTFLFQVDQMAPGLAWQKIPMILSLYLPILKQNPHELTLLVGFQACVVDPPQPPCLFEKVGNNSFKAFHSLVKSLLKLAHVRGSLGCSSRTPCNH